MSIYKEALRDLDRTRTKNSIIKENRTKEVYYNIPRIKELDTSIANLGIKFLKEAMYSKNIIDYTENLKKEISKLKSERETLLESKYPKGYLLLVYDCDKCEDTGYTDGKTCYCLNAKVINRFLNISGFKDILETENFESFDFRLFSDEIDKNIGISPLENIQAIYKVAMDFVYNFPNSFKNLLFYGPSGVGKTFLCNCIAKDIINIGHPVLYTSSTNLAKNIENSRFNKENHNPEELALYYKCPLLIVDDLGTEFSTIVTQSEFFSIINSRLLEKRATIISTNLNFKDLEAVYSSRIVSRLYGGYRSFKFFGKDIRIAKKVNKAYDQFN